MKSTYAKNDTLQIAWTSNWMMILWFTHWSWISIPFGANRLHRIKAKRTDSHRLPSQSCNLKSIEPKYWQSLRFKWLSSNWSQFQMNTFNYNCCYMARIFHMFCLGGRLLYDTPPICECLYVTGSTHYKLLPMRVRLALALGFTIVPTPDFSSSCSCLVTTATGSASEISPFVMACKRQKCQAWV